MIRIRPAGKEDVLTLQKLNYELFVDNQKFDSELKMEWPMSDEGSRYFQELIIREDTYLLIADDNEIPVGYLVAEEREVEYRKGKSVFIENMAVTRNQRHKGIGGMLISELVNLVNEKGIKKIYAATYLKNSEALGFYRKNGFRDIDITLEKSL